MHETLYRDAADMALESWAAWLMEHGDADSVGGGDRVGPPIRSNTDHSDPVLAKVVRTLTDEEARHASRVDGYLREYGWRVWFTCRLHYAGELVAEKKGDHYRWRFSGPKDVTFCATRMGISISTVYERLKRAKQGLLVDLHMAKEIRQGSTGEVKYDEQRVLDYLARKRDASSSAA